MSENKEIIEFKSVEPYFYAECMDIKNHTSRFTYDWNKERWKLYHKATHIRIRNPETNIFFTKKITHKCEYSSLAIITWADRNKPKTAEDIRKEVIRLLEITCMCSNCKANFIEKIRGL